MLMFMLVLMLMSQCKPAFIVNGVHDTLKETFEGVTSIPSPTWTSEELRDTSIVPFCYCKRYDKAFAQILNLYLLLLAATVIALFDLQFQYNTTL